MSSADRAPDRDDERFADSFEPFTVGDALDALRIAAVAADLRDYFRSIGEIAESEAQSASCERRWRVAAKILARLEAEPRGCSSAAPNDVDAQLESANAATPPRAEQPGEHEHHQEELSDEELIAEAGFQLRGCEGGPLDQWRTTIKLHIGRVWLGTLNGRPLIIDTVDGELPRIPEGAVLEGFYARDQSSRGADGTEVLRWTSVLPQNNAPS